MKLKKLITIVLSLGISIGCVVPAYANILTKSVKYLYEGKTYYYDIDGIKGKDKIKITENKGKSRIYINNKCMKLSGYYNVELYDINRNDKSMEFVLTNNCFAGSDNRILKFKNSKCVVNKSIGKYIDLEKYDNVSGVAYYNTEFSDTNKFDYFKKSTGYEFYPYMRILVNGYSVKTSTTYTVNNKDRKIKFKAKKDLKAYDTISCKQSNWTIGKGCNINIVNLYIKDGKYYIKFSIWTDTIEDSNGVSHPYNKYDYGYMKVGSTRIFVR